MTSEKVDDDEYLVSMQVVLERSEDLAKCAERLSSIAAGFLLDGAIRATISLQKLEVFEDDDT